MIVWRARAIAPIASQVVICVRLVEYDEIEGRLISWEVLGDRQRRHQHTRRKFPERLRKISQELTNRHRGALEAKLVAERSEFGSLGYTVLCRQTMRDASHHLNGREFRSCIVELAERLYEILVVPMGETSKLFARIHGEGKPPECISSLERLFR